MLIPGVQFGFAVFRSPDSDRAFEGHADGYQHIEPSRGLQFPVELNAREAVIAADPNGHHSPSAELGSLTAGAYAKAAARAPISHYGVGERTRDQHRRHCAERRIRRGCYRSAASLGAGSAAVVRLSFRPSAIECA
jgi:hypothetical protein